MELRQSWAINIRSPAHACCTQASFLYAYCVEWAIVDLNLPRSGLVQQHPAACKTRFHQLLLYINKPLISAIQDCTKTFRGSSTITHVTAAGVICPSVMS